MEQSEMTPVLPIGSQLTWDEIRALDMIRQPDMDLTEFEKYHGV